MNFVSAPLASAICQTHSAQRALKTIRKRATAATVTAGSRLPIRAASQSSPFGVRSFCVLR
jgi:hypothetical protein